MFCVKLFTLSTLSIILTSVSIIANFFVAIVVYSITYKPKITDSKLYIQASINSITAGIGHFLSDYSIIYILRYLAFSFNAQITITMIFVYIIDYLLKVLGTYFVWGNKMEFLKIKLIRKLSIQQFK